MAENSKIREFLQETFCHQCLSALRSELSSRITMGWLTGLLRPLHVFRAARLCLKTLRQTRSVRGFSSRIILDAFLPRQNGVANGTRTRDPRNHNPML